MVTEVIMPKLGQTMEEGVIEKWLKQEGDQVKTLRFSLEQNPARFFEILDRSLSD